MFPFMTVAARVVPSPDNVMACQFFMPPLEVSSVHVAPESADVQIFPPQTDAASLVPSLDDVMPYQLFAPPMDVTSVHVAPESVDVQIPEICPVFPLE